MSFTQFTSLPPELQSLIWENCIEGPSMHIFDVCFPSWRKTDRTAKAFEDTEDQSWIEKYSNTAFLDPVDTSNDEMNRVTRIGRYPFDPSMYRTTNSLLSTSRVASGTARFLKFRDDTNTVYLPARKQKVTISNSDVLMLRFRDAGAAIQCAAHILFSAEATSTSNVLKSEWSTEMAETVRNAKKIALDVSESWMSWIYSNAGMQETAYFASTMQRGLEVLYLVDQCAGRCEGCGRAGLKAEKLQKRDECWRRLNSGEDGKVSKTAESREGDVIQGVSKRYVEVFDLKGLGWEVTHPSLFFAMRMQSVIRNQQRGSEDEGKFQGIRVLMVEDESIDGLDTELRVNCRMKGVVDNPMDKLSPENMAAFSNFLEADSVGANHTEGRIFRMALGWDGVVSSDCTNTTV